MRRRALLIGNPGKKGEENYCDGVAIDLSHYRAFLLSPIGGYWYPSEIEQLWQPGASTVRAAIKNVKDSDYGLVIFCGHGYESAQGARILVLNDTATIDSSELREGAPRQTLLLDCCRVVEAPKLIMKSLLEAARALPGINTMECRNCFSRVLERCPQGLTVLSACKSNQTAGDSGTFGGFYSASVLDAARGWSEATQVNPLYCKSFSVVAAHEAAAERVGRISGGRQEPEIEKPRSGPYFPFAIVA